MDRTAALAAWRTQRLKGLTRAGGLALWTAALTCTAIVVAAQSHTPQRTVTAIRHWSLPDTTRVAVEVSGEFDFRYDRLHNPERVYFDILNSRPHVDSRRFYKAAYDDKLVTAVRVAETTPGVTRIVLDLTGPIEITTSKLSNPNRLMIELRPGAPDGHPDGRRRYDFRAGSADRPPIPLPANAPAEPAVSTPPPTPSGAVAPPVSSASKAAPATTKPAVPAPALAVETSTPPAAPAKRDMAPVEIPKAARHTSNGSTSLVRALGLKIGKVVIDPGHGGHDQGTERSERAAGKGRCAGRSLTAGQANRGPDGRRGGLHPHRRHFHSARRPHGDGQRQEGRPVPLHPRQFLVR